MENRIVVTERFNASDFGEMNEGREQKDKVFYTSLGVDVLYEAMNTLKEAELKLWLAFMCNEDMFSWWLYYKQIKLRTGLSKRSYYRAFEGLMEKGYIVPMPDGRYLCRMSPMEYWRTPEQAALESDYWNEPCA